MQAFFLAFSPTSSTYMYKQVKKREKQKPLEITCEISEFLEHCQDFLSSAQTSSQGWSIFASASAEEMEMSTNTIQKPIR